MTNDEKIKWITEYIKYHILNYGSIICSCLKKHICSPQKWIREDMWDGSKYGDYYIYGNEDIFQIELCNILEKGELWFEE